MRRCIYCLESRDESDFNAEHVLPEAFGKFEGNLVLNCVCEPCNSFFGKDVDLKLGRDTVEGLERFHNGLKKPRDYKSLGRRATTTMTTIEEGPFKGLRCETRPSSDGESLMAYPLPQVGFAQSEDTDFEYFLLNELPTPNDLKAKGYKSGSLLLRIWEAGYEEAVATLVSRGFSEPDLVQERAAGNAANAEPTVRRIETEYLFRISHPEFRAISKIALNFFASVTNAGIALMPQFNEIRRYVRYDVRPERAPVRIIRSVAVTAQSAPSVPVLCHFVAAQSTDSSIFAQVCLGNRFRYLVELSAVPFAVQAPISECRVFDILNRTVGEAAPPEL
jgi:HNH endonuclease